MGGFSLLGQLAGGYAQAAERDRQRAFEQESQNRQNALGMVKILLENPAVPPEYKGALVQHGLDIVHTPYGKKLPSTDKMMASLPQIGTPAQTQQAPIPAVQLGMPATPPAPQGIGTGVQQGAPSLTQGATAANGGAFPSIGPKGTMPAVAPPPLPPGSPIPAGPTLPGGSQAVTQAASPNYTPAGQFHMMSPQEIAQRDAQMQLQRAQEISQSTGLPLAQVLGIKPDIREAGPGTNLFKVSPSGEATKVAEGGPPTAMLTKEKYAVDAGPGGEIRGIIDNTGKQPVHLSPEDAAKIPEAAQLLKDAQGALEAREKRTEMKEQRQLNRTLTTQFNQLTNAIQLGQVKDAEKAVGETRKTLAKLNETANQDEARYQIMQKAYNDVQQHPENVGSFDAALLAFHMGLTVGQIKGMRSGDQARKLHEQARSMGEDFDVAINKIQNGELLSDEQRSNFLKLAQDKMDISRAQLNAAKQNYQSVYNDYKNMGTAVSKKQKTSEAAPGTSGGQLPPGWE